METVRIQISSAPAAGVGQSGELLKSWGAICVLLLGATDWLGSCCWRVTSRVGAVPTCPKGSPSALHTVLPQGERRYFANLGGLVVGLVGSVMGFYMVFHVFVNGFHVFLMLVQKSKISWNAKTLFLHCGTSFQVK